MIKIKDYILILFALSNLFSSFAQKEKDIGYFIENNEIVFVFDVNNYFEATSFNGHKLEFADLDIDEVALSGEFNNWSEKGWQMKRVSNTRFELRKKISDFNDKFSWQFKYVVNNFYWAEPSKKEVNAVKAKRNGYNLGVYNLKFYTATPSDKGNIVFNLEGFEDADRVMLSGTFNFWSEDYFEMYKVENGWQLKLHLPPGEYEYKFIVDGKWMEDPNNPRVRWNHESTLNSVIEITSMEKFVLKGFENASKVVLAGDFNDWNESQTQLTKTNSGWEITLELKAGKYHYKFIVDGEWTLDTDNSIREYDGYGYINSVRMVK